MALPTLMLPIFAAAVVLSGCSQAKEDRKENGAATSTPSPVSTPAPLAPRTAQMWSRSCALCHIDGNASAPRLGHPQEWEKRIPKGLPTLLKHTVEGYKDMPPLGYCMACEAQDFADMIQFMSGHQFEASQR